MPEDANTQLDLPTLEGWLWDAACKIRGPIDAPKYKDYILPLIFLKRLSDVFEDEVRAIAAGRGEDLARELVEADPSLVTFYLPANARWEYIARLSDQVGQGLTDAVRAAARANPMLDGVINVVDFNATAQGQRILSDSTLKELIQVLSRYRLGLRDVEPDMLGRAYEYLLRKFAEGQGQSAGEFYTPRMVGVLIARLLAPEPGMTVYDPACGSAGLLIKAHLHFLERYGEMVNGRRQLPNVIKPLQVFGQENNPSTFAIARMNAFLHRIDAEIRYGDTMRHPAFTQSDGSLVRFDRIAANPMWNQKFSQQVYEDDPYERFRRGIPPFSSADWGWVQHMFASLTARGRMATVLDTGAVSRGSGNQGANRERDIRKAFVEEDLIEAVILLPENLFYNTTAPGIILVIDRAKRRPGEILLINASRMFIKGRPKNEMTEEHAAEIADLYHRWQAREGFSAVISLAEAARNDYNLSPSRYVALNGQEEVLPLEEAVVRLQEAEEERAEADRALNEVLRMLGLSLEC